MEESCFRNVFLTSTATFLGKKILGEDFHQNQGFSRLNKAGKLPTANPMQVPSSRLMLTSKEDPDVCEKMKDVATTHPQL